MIEITASKCDGPIEKGGDFALRARRLGAAEEGGRWRGKGEGGDERVEDREERSSQSSAVSCQAGGDQSASKEDGKPDPLPNPLHEEEGGNQAPDCSRFALVRVARTCSVCRIVLSRRKRRKIRYSYVKRALDFNFAAYGSERAGRRCRGRAGLTTWVPGRTESRRRRCRPSGPRRSSLDCARRQRT